MFEKLEHIVAQHQELERLLADPKPSLHSGEFQKYAREKAALEEIVSNYLAYKRTLHELDENKTLMKEGEEDLRALAREEVPNLKKKLEGLEEKLKFLLLPKDSRDERNVFLEIRAGAGGEEASLFASDLFRMYSRYAERKGWAVEVISSSPTGLGGFKEIIASIEGQGVFSRLKFESGVHRVQRVPRTEASGRIHTSTVTVAVLPEADEVEVDIRDEELRIDTFRSGGHGGQNVNKVETAVRIIHLPTGLVVVCQDERSQHKNKIKAMKVLRARIRDRLEEEQRKQIAHARKSQVGSGDRSEKIRTYNFPQGRVTDHRIGLTLHRIQDALDGDLDKIIEPLITHFQAEALKMS